MPTSHSVRIQELCGEIHRVIDEDRQKAIQCLAEADILYRAIGHVDEPTVKYARHCILHTRRVYDLYLNQSLTDDDMDVYAEAVKETK